MRATQWLRRVFLTLGTSFEKALPQIWVVVVGKVVEWILSRLG